MITSVNNSNTNTNFNGAFKIYFPKKYPNLQKEFENSFKPLKYRHCVDNKENYYFCSPYADLQVANFIKENKDKLKIFSYFPQARKLNQVKNSNSVKFNTIIEMMGFVNRNRVPKSVVLDKTLKMCDKITEKYNIDVKNVKRTCKNGLIKYEDKSTGLELMLSPQTSDGHIYVYYKPKNGYGETVFCKMNENAQILKKYTNPDEYFDFYKKLGETVKEYKSLII